MTKILTYDQLMNPTIQALKALGGSGTIEEIYNKVTEIVELTDDQLEVLHDPKHGSQTEIEYRLAWSRTYLKKFGVLENSSRGVWALTTKGRELDRVDPEDVKRFVKDEYDKKKDEGHQKDKADEIDITWRDELIQALFEMQPDAFERLIQRVLRESGFLQVEVTGKSGDGGIDGKGIMRLGGLLSFHVIFQCKRYQGSVGASQVRDFRGAMVGRADKGLLITTGNFTKSAVQEATRDGAPAIDLIDGDLLVDKLKELGLGVSTNFIQVEQVEVDADWFKSL
jgi:restriction system protein